MEKKRVENQIEQYNEYHVEIRSAIAQEDVQKVKMLLTQVADPFIPHPTSRSNPLHSAVLSGNVEIVNLLIHKGCPIDHQDIQGFTPLHVALLFSQRSMIQTLLDQGADPEIKNLDGHLPREFTSDVSIQSLFFRIQKK